MRRVAAHVLALVLVVPLALIGGPSALAEGDVERRIAEFWKRIDALGPSDLLSATDLGQWGLNVIERDPSARVSVADFRASTAQMQTAIESAGRVLPPASPNAAVERRIAEFWKRIDAMVANERLSAGDLGQWALNVTDRDPGARIAVADFRTATAGMQAAIDGATNPPSTAGLPASCLPVGAFGYVPAPYTIPALDLATRGDVITVTTTADVEDGDTSSAAALAARPGGAGVSLREALSVTNVSPGAYSIRFASALKGATITITQRLNSLTGGNVFLSGDIDGDGSPDVTVRDGADLIQALSVASSGNRIHALTIEGFRQGVMVTADSRTAGATFTNNVVSNNTMREVQEGVLVAGSATITAGRVSRSTANTWKTVRIIGNNIDASSQGVGLFLPSSGDAISGVVIARNTIRIGNLPAANGIQLSSGFRAGSTQNRIEQVLIAENTVDAALAGPPAMTGIWVQAGIQGATQNAADDIRITGNRIRFPRSQYTTGIEFIVADGATDDYDARFQPIEFPEGNTITNVTADANDVSGTGRRGIILTGGCCGGRGNVIDRAKIEGNVVDSYVGPGSDGAVALWGGNSGNFYVRPTEGSQVRNVTIARNTLRYHLPTGWTGIPLAAGGILLKAGNEASKNTISGVTIRSNLVETDAVGVMVVGGNGTDRYPSSQNAVVSLSIMCNQVTRRPTLDEVKDLRGVTLIGGWNSSGGNTIEATVKDNLVVDRLDEVAVVNDRGSGAAGNSAALR